MASGHTITIEQAQQNVRVTHGDLILAESDRPLILRETGSPVRYYIPAEDVRLDLLTPSETHTVCPFKGQASYWRARGFDHEWVAWSYPSPFPEVARIAEYVAFDQGTVSVTIGPGRYTGIHP